MTARFETNAKETAHPEITARNEKTSHPEVSEHTKYNVLLEGERVLKIPHALK